MDVPQDVTDDALADDFEWVFGDYGLGQTVSAESTIFTAFPGDHPTPADEGAVPTGSYEYQPIVDASWFPGPSTHDVRETGDFGFAVPSFDNDYTIDPMAVMATNDFEEESRPSSAPRLNANEGSGQLLSVPRAEMMSRRYVAPPQRDEALTLVQCLLRRKSLFATRSCSRPFLLRSPAYPVNPTNTSASVYLGTLAFL